MRGLRGRLTYSNVMVTFLAFIVLGGGTATALDGSGTIFSEHIVDREVKRPDLAESAVTARAIGRNQVKKPDVAANTITSRKVRRNSLRGSDIREGSLSGIGMGLQGAYWDRITGQSQEFRPPSGYSGPPPRSDFYGEYAAPVNFVARDLFVRAFGFPNGESEPPAGARLQVVFTNRLGRTQLACTITAPSTDCSNLDATTLVSAGDTYGFYMFPSSASAWRGASLMVGWRAVSP